MTPARLIANLLWLPLMGGAAYLLHHQAGWGWGASLGAGALAGTLSTFLIALILGALLDR